tara:strand:+ start:244 stop:435 length:192 start_codon:yes stop_codon:yes gene_type:complete
LKEFYLELVNIFVNTREANTAIINGPNGNWYLKFGGAEEARTLDPLLAKIMFSSVYPYLSVPY